MAKRSSKTIDGGSAAPEKLPVGKRDWIFGLLLALAVVVVYQPVWNAGHIWDDREVVFENPVIVGPLGLKEIWTTSAADICPLTLTTFWAEYKLWGTAVLPYHLVSIFLHAACAILLWLVLRALRIPGAWLGAALWALHPVQVESVAWIAELKNTQSCLFYLLTIFFFVRGRTGWNYALTLIFAAAAMASKSSTLTLPLILCLCAWWMEGRWRWSDAIKIGPIFLMSIVAGVISMWTQNLGRHGHPSDTRSWPERLAQAGDAFWFYLGKLVWPHPLITIYPAWHIDTAQALSYGPLLAMVVLLIFLWLKRDSRLHAVSLAFAYFFLALIPALGLANMKFFDYAYVADHFQYLASMGPLALVGAVVASYAARVQYVLGLGLLLLLGTASWNQAQIYKGEESLWTYTLAWNPDCPLGHNNLGLVLLDKGQRDEAILEYEKAIAIDPTYELGYSNLGLTLFKSGRLDEAISAEQKAASLDPDDAMVYNNLGNAYQDKGKIDEAIVNYQKAIAIRPHFAPLHFNFGNALTKAGRLDEAIAEDRTALQLDPAYAEAHNALGIARAEKGDIAGAMVEFQEAIRLKPDYADAEKNLAKALGIEAAQKSAK